MKVSKLKVLIITYYWPPAGGSGVQRWLKFTKYLRDFDIEPIIYTVKDPNYPQIDNSLEKDIPQDIKVLRQPIFEPNNYLLKSKKKDAKETEFNNPSPSIIGKILQYIRINYFIPDARKFWIKPSVRFLSSFLKDSPVDAIITTGPPHSLHLIGLQLKRKLKLNWIADFRDPWTDIYYNSSFKMSDRTMRKHKQLESQVLDEADHIITTNFHLNDLYTARTKTKVSLITNGYDDEVIDKRALKRNEGFSLDYIGYLPQESDPITLWKALQQIVSEYEDIAKDLKINLTGDINRVVQKSIRDHGLLNYAEFKGYVSHDKAVEMQHNANILLILIAKSDQSKQITPGKIFECLQSKRPILAVGPTDGGAANILNTTKAGKIFDFEDVEGVKKHILALFEQYQKGKLVVNSANIDLYHRKELTRKLSTVIRKTVKD